MKTRLTINVVADYNIGGKRLAWAKQIESCCNLVNLMEMTGALIPCKRGGFINVKPEHISMCWSKRNADETADEWNRGYKADGRLYEFEPLTAEQERQLAKAKEATL
ncbi:MAG: hypothetical protein J6V72_19850 [Kiritimatiellae bacterium]|nr:hypothetical protein [Kiritimatiellia bacterium]